jgi:hypothetical protein
MDLATHQAQATNDTRPDTTPEAIHAQANTIHARPGTTPEANLQDQEGQSRMANALDKRSDECRRSTEAIHAELVENLQGKDNPLLSDCEKSKILNELLFSQWDSKKQALDGVRSWVARNASVCGTGWFKVRFNSWKVPKRNKGKTHGGRGVIQCSIHGCPWHLKYEEAKGGKFVIFDAVLDHNQLGLYTRVDASDLDVAATSGFHHIPEHLKDEVIWWRQTGTRVRDCLRLLNRRATDDGLRHTWDYDTVYNLLRKMPAKEWDGHVLAFAMALHPRLGAGCPVRELDLEIVRLIGEQVVAPCWASKA